jgi:polyisoprenoid-binding protein YceI/mono/diheme cytochrome c family protein
MARMGHWIGSHRLMSSMALMVAVVIGGGWYVWDQVNVDDIPVTYVVPQAPQLVAGDGESLYRVHPRRSTVTYEVEEQLAGVSKTATGSTQGIAGDVVVNEADASQSRFGEIVIDVAQLDSDEELRDRRLRHDFLESGDYPLARFVPATVTGLPDSVADGVDYDVDIAGELTVKTTTAPVVLTGTASRAGDELRLVASTTTKMSTFDIGPISLLGFVRTADDVTLTFDITFVDPTRVDIPVTTRAAVVAFAATGDGPSFGEVVLPVLADNCASCHKPGGVGADVWTLETAGDVVDVASGLSLVTSSRYMPPWPASDLSTAFTHDRSLDQTDIDAIVSWAAAGAKIDVDPATPVVPPAPVVEPVRVDVQLTASEPYVGSTAVRDDYRCFLMRPGIDEERWIAAFEFVPDREEIVHHAIGTRVPGTSAERLQARDDADPGPGWACADLTMAGAGGGSQFLAWAPGQEATRYPDGTGFRLAPDDAIVLQVHYHFLHSAPADLSALNFEFLPTGATPAEIANETYLGPAEIPCRPGLEEGPLCDRATAIADLASRFGIAAAFIPNGLLQRCGGTPEDVGRLTGSKATATCDHVMTRAKTAYYVFGHMHEIGDAFRMTLNPDTPGERVLLDIPVWDFDWQMNYQLAQPLELQRGDVIRIECTWDRAHLKVPEARYITWSEGTVDEMCYSGLTTVQRRGGS